MRWNLLLLITVLLVGAALRGWNFPREREARDIDEGGYLQSSLTLAEGVTPPFKAAPAGAQIWLGWSYVTTKTAVLTLLPGEEEKSVPLVMRPYVALNHVLWDCYYNCEPIRRFELICIGVMSILSIIPAFLLARHYAGLLGATFVGGLIATMPVFVTLAGHTRPYSLAWSIGLFALWQTARSAPKQKWTLAAILIGLSIGTRIEMVCLLPFVLIEHFVASDRADRWKRLISLTGLAILVAVASAPWFFIGILGSLKTIVGVRLLAGGRERQQVLQIIWDLISTQAILLPALLLIAGLFSPLPERLRKHRAALLFTLLLALTMLRPTGYGPQHDGPVYLVLIVYGAIGVAVLAARFAKTGWIIVSAAIAVSLVQSSLRIHRDRAMYAFVNPDEWIQKYIPSGTRVFYSGSLMHPILPTPESANAMWLQVVEPTAWERKFRWGSERLGVASDELPRALSVDVMAKETGFQRQWFILGGRSWVKLPRYNLQIFGNSEVFNRIDLAAEFSGGSCVIASTEKIEGVGDPIVTWTHNGEIRAAVYCTKDLADRLPDEAKHWTP